MLLFLLYRSRVRSRVGSDLLLDMLVLKMRGAARTRINRTVGRQVQIMPTLTSIVDHQPTIQLSQVGFVELAKWMRDCSLRTETTVTLHPKKSV